MSLSNLQNRRSGIAARMWEDSMEWKRSLGTSSDEKSSAGNGL
jgi:hypothetical protein